MDYEEFINLTLKTPTAAPEPQKPKKKRTAEDIKAEFMPLVEADRQRGG